MTDKSLQLGRCPYGEEARIRAFFTSQSSENTAAVKKNGTDQLNYDS